LLVLVGRKNKSTSKILKGFERISLMVTLLFLKTKGKIKMNNRFFLNTTFLLALLFSVASCAVTDIDRTADFSSYRTYVWGEPSVQVSNPAFHSGLIDREIKQAVKDEFAKRGVVYSASNADFIVSYKTFTENKEESTGGHYGYPFMPFGGFFPYGFGWGGWWGPYGMGA